MSVDMSVLEAQPRDKAGKGVARQLRLKGLAPAVVYGKHLDKPVNVAVDPALLKKALNTPHKYNTLLTLKTAGGGERLVLVKDYQQDPVTRAVLHVDFIEVRESEQAKVNVPVVLSGRAQGVADGGILSQLRREVEVFALPRAIPEKIEVDITEMKMNEALHINDIKLPEGVRVKSNVNFTIAVIAVPEGVEVPAAGAAAAAAAPAAGAKAPAGKAPAAAPAAAAGKAPAKK